MSAAISSSAARMTRKGPSPGQPRTGTMRERNSAEAATCRAWASGHSAKASVVRSPSIPAKTSGQALKCCDSGTGMTCPNKAVMTGGALAPAARPSPMAISATRMISVR